MNQFIDYFFIVEASSSKYFVDIPNISANLLVIFMILKFPPTKITASLFMIDLKKTIC